MSRSRFHELCAALNDTLTPALVAAGYAAPREAFSRATARYEFARATPAGIQTLAVLFRRGRPPEFSIQLFVAPIGGLDGLVERGGSLRVGTLSPGRTIWPWPVRTFSMTPTFRDRMLGRGGRSASDVVQSALALLPEVEAWWSGQAAAPHINTGTLRYPGRGRVMRRPTP